MNTCDDCGTPTDKPAARPDVSPDWRACAGCTEKRDQVAKGERCGACGFPMEPGLPCRNCGGETPATFVGPTTTPRPCVWTETPNGFWDTGCNRAWLFETGTPVTNKMRFCPFCGHPLVARACGETDDAT